MARFSCFSTLLVGKKKKSSKDSPESTYAKQPVCTEKPKVKPEELFLEVSLPQTGTCAGANKEKPVPSADMAIERAYKEDQKKDEKLSIKRNLSEEPNSAGSGSNLTKPDQLVQNGSTHLASPKLLKRSCSNIERKAPTLINSPMKKPYSYDDLKNLTDGDFPKEKMKPDSPLSVKSSCSADKVMLKKRSSSQVLPSRSRKLWWRLFMWSHRNLHRPYWISDKDVSQPESIVDNNNNNNKGGYSSDTLEIIDEKKKKKTVEENNQWVAFSAETSYFDRVNAWVNSIPNYHINNNNDNDNNDDNDNYDDYEEEEFFLDGKNDNIFYREIGESSGKDQMQNNHKRRGGDEISQANNVIQSLNILSSVAHIAGMGLKVVPAISAFTSLKAVNLSNNFIVNITTGALPKSLHTLDLSRNKIGVIEGLRELSRLRVLDLSYNRISRIGHGLSNCTAIKELYLAGNKISNVEGLHRLLKLMVLDLSFNKITTSKSLGQLVANYNSLLALNILGNPIQTNIGDDQLKKSVLGLLPKLTYLNKQLIKTQRGREIASDRVTKAALGNGQWGGSSRRKLTRRVSQSGSGSGLGSVRGLSGRNDKGKNRYRK